MWDYPKFFCPMKHGPNYFYYHNTGLQNQRFVFKKNACGTFCFNYGSYGLLKAKLIIIGDEY
jgi:hypothetical protein